MKQRKLLFVSANQYANPYPVYPLGISYITTYLQERLPDFIIRIFDFNLNNHDEFQSFLKDFSPDYIGLSLRNVDDVNFYSKESFISGYKVIVDIIRRNSGAPLIIGGSAFSIYPGELFSLLAPDFGIQGEGEASSVCLIVLNQVFPI